MRDSVSFRMSKLPNIENPEALEKIIASHGKEMTWNDSLRNLIIQNIRRFSNETQEKLLEMLRVQSLESNG